MKKLQPIVVYTFVALALMITLRFLMLGNVEVIMQVLMFVLGTLAGVLGTSALNDKDGEM